MDVGKPGAVLEVEAWATPNGDMTLDQLVDHMAEIGNEVLVIDRAGNRLKVLQVSQPLDYGLAQSLIQGGVTDA